MIFYVDQHTITMLSVLMFSVMLKDFFGEEVVLGFELRASHLLGRCSVT
jgi:hypothetical protein